MREKVLKTATGPAYRMIEIKFGSYPGDAVRDGHAVRRGAPIAWTPIEVAAGAFQVELPEGTSQSIGWDEVRDEPGWCKLDWVVADPVRHTISNASNMLDVTWEAPDGTITPLDGYLDPYFQEVYLEAQSIPIFSKLAKHVSADALEDYVEQLEKEIRKYLTKDINYGKAAKRMYNVFRLTGRYQDAAFIRELFDEPTTMLYQVWSLIRTIDDATKPGAEIEMGSVTAQADELILHVVDVLEGEHESEIVRHLLRLRDALGRHVQGSELSTQAEAARAEVINIVNNFFYDKLSGVPSISTYMGSFRPVDSTH